MSVHDPLCDAGPDDNGWAPPCVRLTRTDWDEFDYPSCSNCWSREDNCRCQCDLIREVRADVLKQIHRIYGIEEQG